MDKYTLKVTVRKGMSRKSVAELNIDTESYAESFKLRELEVFDRDSYMVFELEKLEQEVE